MNYELAKKLKDAGFPQTEEKYCKCRFLTMEEKDVVPVVYDCKTERVSNPSLSELIEACGDRFLSVMHVVGADDHQNYWIATDRENIGSHKHEGSSPEEAVANLWLELNKKQ